MTSLSVTKPFLFAQLCKELTEITASNATIFNLYRDISGVREPWLLSISEFMVAFYPHQGNFSLNCDATGVTDTLWHYLNNWDYEPGGAGSTTSGLFDVSFNLVSAVQGQWARDLKAPIECWTACSLLHITRELLKANYICNLKCNVCCTMSSFELAEALNSLSNADSNILNQYGSRNASQPILLDDRLSLSVLFTNSNILCHPVDLRLHFQMIIRDTWKSERTAPFTHPSSGHWVSLDASTTLTTNPAVVTEIRINKDSLCSGINYREFQTNDYLNGRTMVIAGESDVCPHIEFSPTITTLFNSGEYNIGVALPNSAGEYSLWNGIAWVLDCTDTDINSIVFFNTDSGGIDRSAEILSVTPGQMLTIERQSNGYPNNYCLLEVTSTGTGAGTESFIAGTWQGGVGTLSGAINVYLTSNTSGIRATYTITDQDSTSLANIVAFKVNHISTSPIAAMWSTISRNSSISIK